MLSRVGDADRFNPCKADSNCGPNTNCIADEDDSYECECKAGFTGYETEDGVQDCVDINECATGDNICDHNANCINTPGGYNCQCLPEFEGDGYVCSKPRPQYQTTPRYYVEDNSESEVDPAPSNSPYPYHPQPSQPTHVAWDPSPSSSYPSRSQPSQSPSPSPPTWETAPSPSHPNRPYPSPSYPQRPTPSPYPQYPRPTYQPPSQSLPDNGEDSVTEQYDPYDPIDDCESCSQYADCINGECYCRDGWNGDGVECEYICDGLDIWDGEECVPNTEDEGE